MKPPAIQRRPLRCIPSDHENEEADCEYEEEIDAIVGHMNRVKNSRNCKYDREEMGRRMKRWAKERVGMGTNQKGVMRKW